MRFNEMKAKRVGNGFSIPCLSYVFEATEYLICSPLYKGKKPHGSKINSENSQGT